MNRIIQFFRETKTEMTKVSWPTRHEIIGSTIVTIVVSVVVSVFIGIVDFMLDRGVRAIF